MKRELELNATEETDNSPMATMVSASTNSRNLQSNGIATNKGAYCSYYKANDHFWYSSPKVEKKKEKEAKIGKIPQRQTYPPCGTCGEKNQPPEICWQGAGAHLRTKRTRLDEKTNYASNESPKNSMMNDHPRSPITKKLPPRKKPESKNEFRRDSKYMTVFRFDIVISDPPTTNFRQSIKDTNGTASDGQD